MTRYRLYVGSGESSLIAGYVARQFQGATVIPVIAVWNGRLEEATIVEIILKRPEPARIERLVERLRSAFDQESVLTTQEAVRGWIGSREPVRA